jgi:sugar porter (SP) family MFS transporter
MPHAGPAAHLPAPALLDKRTVLPVVLGALGFLLFGYDTGVIAGALLFIRAEMALTPAEQGLVVSILLAGAALGAVVSGRLVERFGHRKLLMTAGLLFTLGAGLASLAVNVEMLIGARFIIGLAVGAASTQVMLYLSEIAPTQSRGALSTIGPLTGTTGILISYIVGYALSGQGLWRWMFAVAIIPSVLLTLGMLIAPDSPRWLARHGRLTEARATLAMVYPPDEVDQELDRISSVARHPSLGLLALFTDRSVRRPVLIACALAILQQVVGINTVVYYAPTILRNIGFGASNAILTTSCLQLLAVISSVFTARIVDGTGRRPLLMTGAAVMGVALVSIGLIMSTPLSMTTGGHVIAVISLAIYKMAFSFSWGPLVWVMMPEILPQRVRGPGMGFATLTNWASNFVVSLLFPILLSVGALIVFGVFVAFCAVAFAFTALVLRETARVSLETIETQEMAEFAGVAAH